MNLLQELKEYYDLFLGDYLRDRKWIKRRDTFDARTQGLDFTNLDDLTRAEDVLHEMGITKIDDSLTSYLGASSSKYYKTISPEDFDKKRRKIHNLYEKSRL